MKKVIDTNCLQSQDLSAYLSESSQNIAVITEYTAIETYKSKNYRITCKSFEILSKFPQQVAVLKNTIDICGMNLLGSNLNEEIINKRETRLFQKFCTSLFHLKNKPPEYKYAFEHLEIAAKNQVSKIEKGAPKFREGFNKMAKLYTSNEIKDIRQWNYSYEVFSKIMKHVMLLAKINFEDHPSIQRIPELYLWQYSFIFRYSLCGYVLFLNWISDGSQNINKNEKIRNDIIDINFATFALYFDGILTNDKKLIKVYEYAKMLLKDFFCYFFELERPAKH